MKIIILLGVHGSGKGEQMSLLAKEGIVEDVLSTGEAYRNVFNPKSRYYKYRNTYGKYVARGWSEKGKYPPDGEVIAMVGTTGRSTGTHLHFEVYIANKRVNPLPYIR